MNVGKCNRCKKTVYEMEAARYGPPGHEQVAIVLIGLRSARVRFVSKGGAVLVVVSFIQRFR